MWRPVSGHRICETGAIPAGQNGTGVPAPSQEDAAARQPSPAHTDVGPCWLAQTAAAQLEGQERASCRQTGIGCRLLAVVLFPMVKCSCFGLPWRDGTEANVAGESILAIYGELTLVRDATPIWTG